MNQKRRSGLSSFLIIGVLMVSAYSQTQNPVDFSEPPGSGKRIVLRPNGMPKPFDSESVRNPPKVISQPTGARLELPAGFDLSVFSEGDYKYPRWIKEGPNGDLFLADTESNAIFLLRDVNRDGKIDNAKERFTFATGLNKPFGMAG